MTWTVTDRGSTSGSSGSGDLTIASFTPTANSLLLVGVPRSSDSTISGITGHGTWSNVTTIDDMSGAGRNRDLEIWGCRVGGSPSASALTISRTAYIFRCDAHCVELSETAGLAGTTVGDALGTGANDSGYRSSAPLSISTTLAAFAQSTNLTLVICMGETTYTGSAWAPDTGYTEVGEWDSASTNFNCATHYDADEDTSPSATLNTNSIGAGIWAVEVKHAAAASSNPSTLLTLGVG